MEPSPHDADTVYVAATRYKLSDYKPYLYRSSDGGRNWQSINGNFPQGEITRVVWGRSRAQGAAPPPAPRPCSSRWMTGDLAACAGRAAGGAGVLDLKIKHGDLIAGTHGRAFWILDDLTSLRALPAKGDAAAWPPPRETVRTRLHHGALGGAKGPVSFQLVFGIGGAIVHQETPEGLKIREHLDIGESLPIGTLLWDRLPAGHDGAVKLTFRDGAGKEIASYASDDKEVPVAKRPTAIRSGPTATCGTCAIPWVAKMDGALALPKPKPLVGDGDATPGPLAVPGRYTAEIAAGGATQSQPFSIVKDPRLPTTPAQHKAQFDLLVAADRVAGRGEQGRWAHPAHPQAAGGPGGGGGRRRAGDQGRSGARGAVGGGAGVGGRVASCRARARATRRG